MLGCFEVVTHINACVENKLFFFQIGREGLPAQVKYLEKPRFLWSPNFHFKGDDTSLILVLGLLTEQASVSLEGGWNMIQQKQVAEAQRLIPVKYVEK